MFDNEFDERYDAQQRWAAVDGARDYFREEAVKMEQKMQDNRKPGSRRTPEMRAFLRGSLAIKDMILDALLRSTVDSYREWLAIESLLANAYRGDRQIKRKLTYEEFVNQLFVDPINDLIGRLAKENGIDDWEPVDVLLNIKTAKLAAKRDPGMVYSPPQEIVGKEAQLAWAETMLAFLEDEMPTKEAADKIARLWLHRDEDDKPAA